VAALLTESVDAFLSELPPHAATDKTKIAMIV
jgi:hypothetical protein